MICSKRAILGTLEDGGKWAEGEEVAAALSEDEFGGGE